MPRQSSSRKRRSTEEVSLCPPAQPMSESATKAKEFDNTIFPLKRTNLTMSRLDSESSSSSSSSSTSCHDFAIHLPPSSVINNDIDDELNFLFNDPPLPPQATPLQQPAAETIAEPPSSVLDCFANDNQAADGLQLSTAPAVEVANVDRAAQSQLAAVGHQRVKRIMKSEYQPSISRRPSSGAQSVLHTVDRLLESTKKISSETSLLHLQAAKLVDDVITSRRLHENKQE